MPPITVGQLTKMVVLRKAIADGTARPEDIADFEATSKERQEALDKAIGHRRRGAGRGPRATSSSSPGMWNALYQVAKLVREMGYSAKDFHPDNCIYVGGGLKRAQLPADYQRVRPRDVQHPARPELPELQHAGAQLRRCRAARRAGATTCRRGSSRLILNKDGDALLPHDRAARSKGRAAFFDLSLDGRWGGVITGDKISLDLGPCACGNAGPSIRDDIVRYADSRATTRSAAPEPSTPT